MPQVHGPVADAIEFAESLISRELNAATDNPLVFENGELLSGGNFHGQAVALALDVLAIAMTNLATMAERRIDRLVHPDLNQGLPPFLTKDAGVCSGFMMAQVTAAALASECKVLSHPASVDTIPTDGSKEDVVPMAMTAAWKLWRVVRNVQHVIGIEFMCAAQGVEYRRPLRSARAVEDALAIVRELVAPLAEDRVLAPDIQSLANAIASGRFTDVAMTTA
jgi:histidine ammonia-lyase